MTRIWRQRLWIFLFVIDLLVATVNVQTKLTWIAIVLGLVALHGIVRNEKEPMPGYLEYYESDE